MAKWQRLNGGAKEYHSVPAAPVDTRHRTPLISFCTVQQRTLCAVHYLATLCLFMTSSPDPGELPGFWGFMVFRHTPIHRRGSGNNNNNNKNYISILFFSCFFLCMGGRCFFQGRGFILLLRLGILWCYITGQSFSGQNVE